MEVRDLLCGWFGLTRSQEPLLSSGFSWNHSFVPGSLGSEGLLFPILLSTSYVYSLLANKEIARV